MRRKAFPEGRNALTLRDAESGTPVAEACRETGFPGKTFAGGK